MKGRSVLWLVLTIFDWEHHKIIEMCFCNSQYQLDNLSQCKAPSGFIHEELDDLKDWHNRKIKKKYLTRARSSISGVVARYTARPWTTFSGCRGQWRPQRLFSCVTWHYCLGVEALLWLICMQHVCVTSVCHYMTLCRLAVEDWWVFLL